MVDDSSLDGITRTIVNSIAALFAEPQFDCDEGEVRFIDRDDRCIWLGLFPTDEDGQPVGKAPTVTWTIEVSHDN